MDQPITVVAGFPRCGSSLVMRLLEAAGVLPADGEFPDYEGAKTQALGRGGNADWVLQAGGKAFKVLGLEYLRAMPAGVTNLRWIWLDRNSGEQAKSHVKFLKQMLVPMKGPERETVARLARSIVRDRAPARAMISLLGGPVLELTFEQLIGEPLAAAGRICEFVGAGDPAELVKHVVERSTDCLPGMLEFSLVSDAGG